jgi:hypothetical protein
MNLRSQRLCAWCAPVFVLMLPVPLPVVAFGAWVMAMFVCVLRTINAEASSSLPRG